jgi:hypothetical protein
MTWTFSNERDEIIEGMAKAFFASAWADQHEEEYREACDTGKKAPFLRQYGTLSGVEIFDVMPKTIDPAAKHAAQTLMMDMERQNKATVEVLYAAHPATLTPANWGHYAAMAAMGHGVGLWEYTDAVIVPHVEFGSHSLERDYFPLNG